MSAYLRAFFLWLVMWIVMLILLYTLLRWDGEIPAQPIANWEELVLLGGMVVAVSALFAGLTRLDARFGLGRRR